MVINGCDHLKTIIKCNANEKSNEETLTGLNLKPVVTVTCTIAEVSCYFGRIKFANVILKHKKYNLYPKHR